MGQGRRDFLREGHSPVPRVLEEGGRFPFPSGTCLPRHSHRPVLGLRWWSFRRGAYGPLETRIGGGGEGSRFSFVPFFCILWFAAVSC